MLWYNYDLFIYYNNYVVISVKLEIVEELYIWYIVYSGSFDIIYFCILC